MFWIFLASLETHTEFPATAKKRVESFKVNISSPGATNAFHGSESWMGKWFHPKRNRIGTEIVGTKQRRKDKDIFYKTAGLMPPYPTKKGIITNFFL